MYVRNTHCAPSIFNSLGWNIEYSQPLQYGVYSQLDMKEKGERFLHKPKRIQLIRKDLNRVKCVKDKQWNIIIHNKEINMDERRNLTRCSIKTKRIRG